MMLGLILIFTILIGIWFYTSARAVGKNKIFWFLIGLFTCFILGGLFMKFGELYILPQQKNLADVIANRNSKIYLEIAIMILISGYAYIIRSLFLSKKRVKKLQQPVM